MNLAKQFRALLLMNLAGIRARIGLVCTIVVGVACAVGVLVSMLAMGAGARREAMVNVRPDRAILMSSNAQQPTQSSVPKDTVALIRSLPGIRRNAQGEPIVVALTLVNIAELGQLQFPIYGVTSGLTDYWPEFHLTSGRMFRPGLRELITSSKCARQFSDFAVGARRDMRGGAWLVVGHFDLGRTEGLCTVFTDSDTLLSSFGHNTYNQVNVMLQSAGSFGELTDAINADPALHVVARYEAEVVAESTRQLNGILNFVSYFVGSIMAIAATIGTANSLYAIVDGRRRELATLRAVGFNGAPIIASILSESMLLALPGALIGAWLAWFLFNGMSASPMGASFHLAVTRSLVYVGIAWALTIGALSGLLPAVRAARLSVTVALRAT